MTKKKRKKKTEKLSRIPNNNFTIINTNTTHQGPYLLNDLDKERRK